MIKGYELIISVEDNGPDMSANTISKFFSVSDKFGLPTRHGRGVPFSCAGILFKNWVGESGLKIKLKLARSFSMSFLRRP
jgi:hypothetical protein